MIRRRSKNPHSSTTVAKQRSSKHATKRSRYPRLHLADLGDDSHVLGAADQLATADRDCWKLSRELCRAQLRHQRLASDDAFAAQLEVEEIATERANLVLLLVARWAFHEGRRGR